MSTQQPDRVIPLPQAAQRMGLAVEVLTRLVHNGMIKAVTLPNGEIFVDEEETQQTITKEQFKHLRGKAITLPDATKRYGISGGTFRGWIQSGWIKVLKPGYRMELDLADVAYCAAVYEEKKKHGDTFGARIFDEAGRPYRLKHPQLAKYRRNKKKAQKK